jgi:hypothetical protein
LSGAQVLQTNHIAAAGEPRPREIVTITMTADKILETKIPETGLLAEIDDAVQF